MCTECDGLTAWRSGIVLLDVLFTSSTVLFHIVSVEVYIYGYSMRAEYYWKINFCCNMN